MHRERRTPPSAEPAAARNRINGRTATGDPLVPLSPEQRTAYRRCLRTHDYDDALRLATAELARRPDDPRSRRLVALLLAAKAAELIDWAALLGVALREERSRAVRDLLERAVRTDPDLPEPRLQLIRLDEPEADHGPETVPGGVSARPPDPGSTSSVSVIRHSPTLHELLFGLLAEPETTGHVEAAAAVKARILARVRAGALSLPRLRGARLDCLRLPPASAGRLLDVLHGVAVESGDLKLQQATLEDQTRALTTLSTELQRHVDEDPECLRYARRAGRRGLERLSSAGIPIDPDVYGDLLVTHGQAHAHPAVDRQLGAAFTHYVEALERKREAGHKADAVRLEELLRGLIAEQAAKAPLPEVAGGEGAGVADLEAALAAAARLGNPHLVALAGLSLAATYRALRQPQSAEGLLRSVLASWPMTPELEARARSELAASLVEQSRPGEARELQEALLADPALLGGPRAQALGWLRLGGARRDTGDLAGGAQAFERALELLPASGGREFRLLRGRAIALLAEAAFLSGRPHDGEVGLASAAALFAAMPLPDALDFHAIAARCRLRAGDHASALDHVKQARTIQRHHLAQQPDAATVQRLLTNWVDLDSCEVELALAGEQPRVGEALGCAEAAKHRQLGWLQMVTGAEADRAFDPEYQQEALRRAKALVTKAPSRLLVSIFATPRGLALFCLGPGAVLRGMWLSDFDYQQFARDHYAPWEAALDAVAETDGSLWPATNALTEFLLDRIGEWLWRAFPDLRDGGDGLILAPHLLFRNLPLAHCRVPGGPRLSELFRDVVTIPSLHVLGANDDPGSGGAGGPSGLRAYVDPDGSLPLTRLEGIVAAATSGAAGGVTAGDAITVAALGECMRNGTTGPGSVVHLSCHADFHQANPWLSRLRAADSDIRVHELLAPGGRTGVALVVLGVCEAGRIRRSPHDGPASIAELLVLNGVPAVVAPMWKVGDLVSLLFLTEFHKRCAAGTPVARAVTDTGRWLRHLQASEIRRRLDGLAAETGRAGGKLPDPSRHAILSRFEAAREWLDALPGTERPFRSPLDWAAFVLTGLPSPIPQESPPVG